MQMSFLGEKHVFSKSHFQLGAWCPLKNVNFWTILGYLYLVSLTFLSLFFRCLLFFILVLVFPSPSSWTLSRCSLCCCPSKLTLCMCHDVMIVVKEIWPLGREKPAWGRLWLPWWQKGQVEVRWLTRGGAKAKPLETVIIPPPFQVKSRE